MVVPDAEGAGNNPPLVAWDLLERSLAVFAAHRLSRLVAVHAAVIGWHGRALVVPAVSGGGKSTLSLAAHQVGASVMSDEYALIDPETGFVTGWHRPVRILTRATCWNCSAMCSKTPSSGPGTRCCFRRGR